MFKATNRHSIFFYFTIIFIIGIFLIIGSFTLLLEHNQQFHHKTTQEKYFPIARLIDKEYYEYGLTTNLINAIKDMGYEFTNKKEDIDSFFTNKDIKFLTQRQEDLHMIALFTDQINNYLYFQTPFEEFLIIDKNVKHQDDSNTIIFIFALLLITFLTLGFVMYKKLIPLKKLKDEIKGFSKQNKDSKFAFIKRDKKDEVSQLAYEFENTINEINQLKEARNVFIRNIMHELKTPITKGKFLVELPSGEKNKEMLKTLFYRLESLIEEFASIEEIILKKDNLNKKKYLFDDILDNAIDLLYLDKTQVLCSPNSLKLDVNFKLFSIAIKNLIDNGIKYSVNKSIKIQIHENEISFINEGKKLANSLNEYFKPFNKTITPQESTKQTKGFGLGLYIVKSILDAHNMSLSYSYENKQNIFTILNNPA